MSSKSLFATRSQSTFLKSQLYSTLYSKFSSELNFENFYQKPPCHPITVDHQNALSYELTFETTRSESTFLKNQLYSTLYSKFRSKLTIENF